MGKKDNQPMVSVIVPVYRAEKYIRQCVDSLLGQTYRNIEVILVDDGSPDRSGAICDEYAAQDCRVKVIHQLNGGVSVARQTGMDNATGEYFIHADPDDWVETTMIEELVVKAIEEDADMVICDFYIHRKGEMKYVEQQPKTLNPLQVMEQMLVKSSEFQQLHGSCWNKLVRRACSNVDFADNRSKPIRFEPDNLRFCEDLVFNCRLLKTSVRSISYLNKAFYHYELREGSLSFTYGDNICRSIAVLDSLIDSDDVKKQMTLKCTYVAQLFEAGRLSLLKGTYKETYAYIIQQYPKSFLSLALRGFPYMAYALYKCKRLFF